MLAVEPFLKVEPFMRNSLYAELARGEFGNSFRRGFRIHPRFKLFEMSTFGMFPELLSTF